MIGSGSLLSRRSGRRVAIRGVDGFAFCFTQPCDGEDPLEDVVLALHVLVHVDGGHGDLLLDLPILAPESPVLAKEFPHGRVVSVRK